MTAKTFALWSTQTDGARIVTSLKVFSNALVTSTTRIVFFLGVLSCLPVVVAQDTARAILDAWRQGRRVRDVVARGELQRRMRDMLQLYADETVALSGAVRLPAVLEPLRVRLARRLREAMERAARSVVRGAHAAGQKG